MNHSVNVYKRVVQFPPPQRVCDPQMRSAGVEVREPGLEQQIWLLCCQCAGTATVYWIAAPPQVWFMHMCVCVCPGKSVGCLDRCLGVCM